MTTEKKEQIKSTASKWLEFIPKAITPALLITILWNGSKWVQESRTLQFDSITDKVNTTNHINNALNDVEIYQLRHHVTDPNVHMSKEAKDSVYVPRREFVEFMKEVNWQNKLIRDDQKKILNEVRSINH